MPDGLLVLCVYAQLCTCIMCLSPSVLLEKEEEQESPLKQGDNVSAAFAVHVPSLISDIMRLIYSFVVKSYLT